MAVMRFLCRGCGKRLKAPCRWAGKRARCPRCWRRLRVPNPEPAAWGMLRSFLRDLINVL